MKTLFWLIPFAAFAQAPNIPTASDPVVTHRVDAEYTAEARAADYQGTVTLYVEVTPEGNTENIQVIQGLGLGLDAKAMEAVSQWHYTPGTLNGKPARMAVSENITFFRALSGWLVRRAIYTVNRNRNKSEQLQKPVLTSYISPGGGTCADAGGNVGVSLHISENGAPENVQVIDSSSDALREAAIQAVGAWRYHPGTANRRPRAAEGRLELVCGTPAPVGDVAAVSRVGGGVSAPSVTYKIDPEYSEEARRAKYQGSVLLELIVDSTGHAGNVRILRMVGLGLDEKAMAAVHAWRFKPGLKDGRPVNIAARVEVTFRLL